MASPIHTGYIRQDMVEVNINCLNETLRCQKIPTHKCEMLKAKPSFNDSADNNSGYKYKQQSKEIFSLLENLVKII